MNVDVNIKYHIKKLEDEKYSLSIKGSMQWVSGFLLFIIFAIFLSAAFFLPMGYSIKSYLKIVIPVLLIFTAVALFASYFFKKISDKWKANFINLICPT